MSTTQAKFKWNEETTKQAVALYVELLGTSLDAKGSIDMKDVSDETHRAANSEKSLNDIASQIGAKSGRAVRGKLAKEGVYQTLEAVPAPSTSTRISKAQYVRSIAKGLGMDLETVQTLDKANTDALQELAEKANKLLEASGQDTFEIK